MTRTLEQPDRGGRDEQLGRPPGSALVKVFTQGTHRVREPEETWAVIEPLFGDYGVTRVSDVTGLDVLGIPVSMATRPFAWTLSVSQGKGQTRRLAKVSAAMEAIEFWHAEHHRPALSHRATPARDLGLDYDVRDVADECTPFLDELSPLDWVDGVGMLTGRTVPVPVDAVCFRDPTARVWSPFDIRPTSNGLASGNCREEAALHALYEVVERDALSRPTLAELGTAPVVDPGSVPDPTCARMSAAVTSAGGRLSIARLPNRFGIPTFSCTVWSWDLPVVIGGSGAHGDPAVALSRAVTEAAQGRVAAIVGSRDDLEVWDTLDGAHRKASIRRQFPSPTATYAEAAGVAHTYPDITEELSRLARRVAEVTGSEPVLVDLSSHRDFAVVKVLVPGCAMRYERVHGRTEPIG